MKKLYGIILIIACLGNGSAQTLKFGHIDLNDLIQNMPEGKKAEAELNKFQNEMEEVLIEMQQSLQNMVNDIEQMEKDASQIKKDAKMDELQNLQVRIQNYKITAQQQIQKKYDELFTPIYIKATEAINDVAKEHGLLYVFNTNSNAIVYKSNQSIDIFPYVKQRLFN